MNEKDYWKTIKKNLNKKLKQKLNPPKYLK